MNRRLLMGNCAMLLTFAALAGVNIANGQAKEPFAGNWQLARGKSEFNPDNTLQQRTLAITAQDGGIKVVQRTVVANGNTVESEYTAKFDGKDNPISVSALDTVSLKRIDANTLERTGKVGGKAVETATMKLSNGGKTLTIVTKGMNEEGEYSSTQVFDRQ